MTDKEYIVIDLAVVPLQILKTDSNSGASEGGFGHKQQTDADTGASVQ